MEQMITLNDIFSADDLIGTEPPKYGVAFDWAPPALNEEQKEVIRTHTLAICDVCEDKLEPLLICTMIDLMIRHGDLYEGCGENLEEALFDKADLEDRYCFRQTVAAVHYMLSTLEDTGEESAADLSAEICEEMIAAYRNHIGMQFNFGISMEQTLFLSVLDWAVDKLRSKDFIGDFGDALGEALFEQTIFESEEEFENNRASVLRAVGLDADQWEQLTQEAEEFLVCAEDSDLIRRLKRDLGAENQFVRLLLSRLEQNESADDVSDLCIAQESADGAFDLCLDMDDVNESWRIQDDDLAFFLSLLAETAHLYANEFDESMEKCLQYAIGNYGAFDADETEACCEKMLRISDCPSLNILAGAIMGMLEFDREQCTLTKHLLQAYPNEHALHKRLFGIWAMFDADRRITQRGHLHKRLRHYIERASDAGVLEYEPTGDFRKDVINLLEQIIRNRYTDLVADDSTPHDEAIEFLKLNYTLAPVS